MHLSTPRTFALTNSKSSLLCESTQIAAQCSARCDGRGLNETPSLACETLTTLNSAPSAQVFLITVPKRPLLERPSLSDLFSSYIVVAAVYNF